MAPIALVYGALIALFLASFSLGILVEFALLYNTEDGHMKGVLLPVFLEYCDVSLT